jgi:Ca-activated chloride channel homolog
MKQAKVAALIVLLGALAQAQDDAVFRSDTRLVEVHATVTDKQGRLLTDLPESAFKIYENDVLQEIKVFKREDAPVSLGLIIDSSASMQTKHAQVAAAALKLVRASNREDEVFIMTFNDKPALVEDFTHDIGKLEKTLNKVGSAGATAMRDAVLLGVEHLKRVAVNDKKVVLVVSDGEDNSSFQDLDSVVRMARQSDILIYGVGLLSNETARSAAKAKRDLDALTVETGGEVFYPKELSEVDEIAEHVAHDLRNQYTITYNPTDPKTDGKFRRIRVTVAVPDAVVKTRSGYFADPPIPRSASPSD